MTDPRDRPPPRVAAILRALRDNDIDWVLSGSAVLAVYGADIAPNDLDVVPDLEAANLARLAGLLGEVNAVPAHVPEWESSLGLEECLQWKPAPPTAEQLDHLFVTDLGMLDVPPAITGSFAELRDGATRVKLAGVEVLVCDPDEALARLPKQPRRKDRRRAAAYAAIRDLPKAERRPRDLAYWQFPPMP